MADESPSPAQLRALKSAAREELSAYSGVQGLGVGDGVLRVYVRSAETRAELPSTFRGVPLEVVVVGDITAR